MMTSDGKFDFIFEIGSLNYRDFNGCDASDGLASASDLWCTRYHCVLWMYGYKCDGYLGWGNITFRSFRPADFPRWLLDQWTSEFSSMNCFLQSDKSGVAFAILRWRRNIATISAFCTLAKPRGSMKTRRKVRTHFPLRFCPIPTFLITCVQCGPLELLLYFVGEHGGAEIITRLRLDWSVGWSPRFYS